MRKITEQTSTLQVKPARISRRKITKPFTPLPVGYLDKIPRLLQPMFLLLWTVGKGKPVTEVYRVLAARLGVTIRTAQNYVYALQKLGILRVETRKIERCRNGANTFYFPELDGFIIEKPHEENFVEILKPDLNTTTKALSYTQKRWEHNRFRNHPPAMRELYERNGALIAELRTLRESRKTYTYKENPASTAHLRDEDNNYHNANMLEVLKKWGVSDDELRNL